MLWWSLSMFWTVNTYFLNLRLILLIVLRALIHLIHLVFFSNLLVLIFLLLISNNFPFPWISIPFSLIFDVVLHYQLMSLRFLKWSSTTTDLSWFWSRMQSTFHCKVNAKWFTFFPSFVPTSQSFSYCKLNHS